MREHPGPDEHHAQRHGQAHAAEHDELLEPTEPPSDRVQVRQVGGQRRGDHHRDQRHQGQGHASRQHGEERAREVLLAAGAEKVLAKNNDKVWWRAGWHQMGTCRMGNNPSNSVVNSWGRSHDVKNLFIVDGSIFVTAGAVNPTSTIQALALYIGDQIKNNIQTLFD